MRRKDTEKSPIKILIRIKVLKNLHVQPQNINFAAEFQR